MTNSVAETISPVLARAEYAREGKILTAASNSKGEFSPGSLPRFLQPPAQRRACQAGDIPVLLAIYPVKPSLDK
ncbi:MAG: hypothetical protein BGO12_08875 [Verrucomicrobia bacterium 61-8]|nr:MAG: hypothetical protein BGO12_08875 [Verrucomicrobia bacterium 61-8]